MALLSENYQIKMSLRIIFFFNKENFIVTLDRTIQDYLLGHCVEAEMGVLVTYIELIRENFTTRPPTKFSTLILKEHTREKGIRHLPWEFWTVLCAAGTYLRKYMSLVQTISVAEGGWDARRGLIALGLSENCAYVWAIHDTFDPSRRGIVKPSK